MSATSVVSIGTVLSLGLAAQFCAQKRSCRVLPARLTTENVDGTKPATIAYRHRHLFFFITNGVYDWNYRAFRAEAMTFDVYHRSFLPLVAGLVIFLGVLGDGAIRLADADLTWAEYGLRLFRAAIFAILLVFKGYLASLVSASAIAYSVFSLVENGTLALFPLLGEMLSLILEVASGPVQFFYSVLWLCYGIATSLHSMQPAE